MLSKEVVISVLDSMNVLYQIDRVNPDYTILLHNGDSLDRSDIEGDWQYINLNRSFFQDVTTVEQLSVAIQLNRMYTGEPSHVVVFPEWTSEKWLERSHAIREVRSIKGCSLEEAAQIASTPNVEFQVDLRNSQKEALLNSGATVKEQTPQFMLAREARNYMLNQDYMAALPLVELLANYQAIF